MYNTVVSEEEVQKLIDIVDDKKKDIVNLISQSDGKISQIEEITSQLKALWDTVGAIETISGLSQSEEELKTNKLKEIIQLIAEDRIITIKIEQSKKIEI